MPPSSDIVAPAGAEHNTLYVAIEISRKSWVVGIKSPASERIGLHSPGAADVVGLKDLIEHQQTKTERALGREVRVLFCYEAGYEGFWLARWLDRTMSVETVVLAAAAYLRGLSAATARERHTRNARRRDSDLSRGAACPALLLCTGLVLRADPGEYCAVVHLYRFLPDPSEGKGGPR